MREISFDANTKMLRGCSSLKKLSAITSTGVNPGCCCKTRIIYSCANQLGFYYQAEAIYDGPLAEFLERQFQ